MQTNRPSEKSFGFLWVLVFTGVGLYGLYHGWQSMLINGFFVLSLVLAFVTIFIPIILAPLNSAWFTLGHLLGKVVSPLVLGVIFFSLITPLALIFRMLGRDELKLKPRRVSSYWLIRNPPGPSSDSFKRQF